MIGQIPEHTFCSSTIPSEIQIKIDSRWHHQTCQASSRHVPKSCHDIAPNLTADSDTTHHAPSHSELTWNANWRINVAEGCTGSLHQNTSSFNIEVLKLLKGYRVQRDLSDLAKLFNSFIPTCVIAKRAAASSTKDVKANAATVIAPLNWGLQKCLQWGYRTISNVHGPLGFYQLKCLPTWHLWPMIDLQAYNLGRITNTSPACGAKVYVIYTNIG